MKLFRQRGAVDPITLLLIGFSLFGLILGTIAVKRDSTQSTLPKAQTNSIPNVTYNIQADGCYNSASNRFELTVTDVIRKGTNGIGDLVTGVNETTKLTTSPAPSSGNLPTFTMAPGSSNYASHVTGGFPATISYPGSNASTFPVVVSSHTDTPNGFTSDSQVNINLAAKLCPGSPTATFTPTPATSATIAPTNSAGIDLSCGARFAVGNNISRNADTPPGYSFTTGIPINISLHVNGATSAPSDIPIWTNFKLFKDGSERSNNLVSATLPNYNAEFTYESFTVPGNYRVHFSIDPNNLISESNETNNECDAYLVIGTATPATPATNQTINTSNFAFNGSQTLLTGSIDIKFCRGNTNATYVAMHVEGNYICDGSNPSKCGGSDRGNSENGSLDTFGCLTKTINFRFTDDYSPSSCPAFILKAVAATATNTYNKNVDVIHQIGRFCSAATISGTVTVYNNPALDLPDNLQATICATVSGAENCSTSITPASGPNDQPSDNTYWRTSVSSDKKLWEYGYKIVNVAGNPLQNGSRYDISRVRVLVNNQQYQTAGGPFSVTVPDTNRIFTITIPSTFPTEASYSDIKILINGSVIDPVNNWHAIPAGQNYDLVYKLTNPSATITWSGKEYTARVVDTNGNVVVGEAELPSALAPGGFMLLTRSAIAAPATAGNYEYFIQTLYKSIPFGSGTGSGYGIQSVVNTTISIPPPVENSCTAWDYSTDCNAVGSCQGGAGTPNQGQCNPTPGNSAVGIPGRGLSQCSNSCPGQTYKGVCCRQSSSISTAPAPQASNTPIPPPSQVSNTPVPTQPISRTTPSCYGTYASQDECANRCRVDYSCQPGSLWQCCPSGARPSLDGLSTADFQTLQQTADFDHSGALTIGDHLRFLQNYGTNNAQFDICPVNHPDGKVDSLDASCLLTVLQAQL